ncbi:ATP-binding protein [Pseudomonas sp. F1_0610]|uniref:ATP-binding protein n=1 Tax=Pseudomonas sp. F1_0610 TaxID=3114284 RepID=UPI0039C21BF5
MQEQVTEFLTYARSILERVEFLLPQTNMQIDWQETLAARWLRQGNNGFLIPLQVSLDVNLADLKGMERQRELLEKNTQQLIAGYPANHALLWGARGTGKSSLVRAILAQQAKSGLRLIEVERDNLADLPRIVESLGKLPQKFIVFCDDLSFDAGDDFRILKSVLDGSLEKAPDNVLLYATSNRRHLVSERESDNASWQQVDGEIHPSEAAEDKIALSDRFGLWLSFYPFSQDQYLSVVEHWIDHWAQASQLTWEMDETLTKEAVRWATQRGNRNGRCAQQFAKYWVGRQLLAQDL